MKFKNDEEAARWYDAASLGELVCGTCGSDNVYVAAWGTCGESYHTGFLYENVSTLIMPPTLCGDCHKRDVELVHRDVYGEETRCCGVCTTGENTQFCTC